jgi:hypothetical protein
MSMSTRIFLPVVLSALVILRAHAQVDQAEVLRLADSSTLVVSGRVESVAVGQDAGAIYTYVTVTVEQVFKGDLPSPARVVVKDLGGEVDVIGLHVADQPRFVAGENVLLFLAVRPRDRTLYTVGLGAGRWSIYPDLAGGGRTAINGERSVGLGSASMDRVAASRPHAQPFVSVPDEAPLAQPTYSFPSEPVRWHEADDGVHIPIDYQNVPGGVPGGSLDTAINAWNGANTRLALDRGGSGNPTCPANTFTGNGRIALYWNDPCGEIDDGDTSTYGVGGGFYTTGVQKTIGGVTFNKLLQGLAILNNVGPHVTSPGCFPDAVMHVLGHAVGLGHSSDPSAVMFTTARSGCAGGATGLGTDDLNGIRAIYPAIASGGSPPNAPTAITNSVVLDTVTVSWTPATTGGPAQSYVLEAGSAPGLTDITSMVLNSANTSTVVGAVPTGVYYVRVRARNALGTSGPSPDTTVTVGPCTAPGVPTGLAYTAADNLVTLTWNAPASGITQGYWLFAGFAPGQSNALVQALGATPGFAGVAPFGTYFVRVAARNSCATGPVTADLQVSVQPCTAAPTPPTALSFTRNGNLVTLTWNRPASGSLPSRYQIHAGSAPGASNLLVYTTPTNDTVFQAAAPRGQYFVRVIGQNNCGSSAASNEVQIDVP